MARIDRRVSPNQAAFWTAYELVDIQASGVRAPAMLSSPDRRGLINRINRSLALTTVMRYAVGWLCRLGHTRSNRPGQAKYGLCGTGTEHSGWMGRIQQVAPGRGTLLEALALAWVEC